MENIQTAIEEFKTSVLARIVPVEQKTGDIVRLSAELRELTKKFERSRFAGAPAAADGGFDGNSHQHKAAFMGFLRTGRESALDEYKDMSTGSDPDGGYLMPAVLDAKLTKVLRELSPMRQLATVVKVDTGDFSMIHSVGGTGYSWVGETASRPKTNTPTFAKIKPVVGEVYAAPALTQVVLDDAGFDLENWIIAELSEAFAAAEGDAFVNGDGIVRPRGILTYDISTDVDGTRADDELQYVASGASGAFAGTDPSDKLITLVHAVKPRYRQGASWLMNTSTIEAVRKFKEATTGNYLWKPGLEAGQPGTLLGFPVYEDENMPDLAANSLSIAFGNFGRAYTIVDRSTMMLRDPYSNKPYVSFYSSKRVGGAIRDCRAVKLMKFAAS